jgi:hypothetical protein
MDIYGQEDSIFIPQIMQTNINNSLNGRKKKLKQNKTAKNSTFEDILDERFDRLLEHLVLRLFHGHHIVELVRPDVVDGDDVRVGPRRDVDVVVGKKTVVRRRPHLRSEMI